MAAVRGDKTRAPAGSFWHSGLRQVGAPQPYVGRCLADSGPEVR